MTLSETGPQQAGVPGGAALAAMNSDDFEALVRDALGPGAPSVVWDALTSPEVINRTRAVLTGLRADVQNQTALANADLRQVQADGLRRGDEGKQDYFDARAEQADWRKRALGFQRIVEKRLSLVRSRMPQQAPRPPGSHATRRRNQEALEKLTRAVLAHRDRVLSGEGGEGDDDTLWDCLDSITAVTMRGGEMPLAKWLDWLDEVREDDE